MRFVPSHWRLYLALSIPFLLLLVGAFGYRWIEGTEWTWEDAFFMSAVTLTTVGYEVPHALSHGGRWFTIIFLFFGVFTLFYTATELLRFIVSGELRQALGRDRMERALSQLKDHVIVCGWGRMGRLVCHDFEKQEVPFVIIDTNAELLNDAKFIHGIPLHGDATSDDILVRAGVERARAIVATLPSDADNLYIVLSARTINQKLAIIARAEEESAIPKLRRVGANNVISPYAIGAHRASQAVLKPTVGHFLDMASRHDVDYIVEEILIEAGCPLCGKMLKQSQLHENFGIVVLTIKCITGDLIYNPQGESVLEAGQILIVSGHREQIKPAKEQARAQGA